MSDRIPMIVVLGGINGAGKTTISRALLADTLHLKTFVNADFIAQGLCGFHPESVAAQAGRIILDQLHGLAGQRQDFAFETTLAGRTSRGGSKPSGEPATMFPYFIFGSGAPTWPSAEWPIECERVVTLSRKRLFASAIPEAFGISLIYTCR
jgi:hypothetical protein